MRRTCSAWALASCLLLASCCSVPSYTPAFWNDGGTVQYGNNCYNYANNKRTDTFAQPGRAAGAMYTALQCPNVGDAAAADRVDRLTGSSCPKFWIFSEHTKLALVVAPGWDYHWYRQDKGGMWTHKPGGTKATNLDSAGNPITDPRTAARGPYTQFCGFHCSCSSRTEGAGHEKIN